jgi:hypothetical protein
VWLQWSRLCLGVERTSLINATLIISINSTV